MAVGLSVSRRGEGNTRLVARHGHWTQHRPLARRRPQYWLAGQHADLPQSSFANNKAVHRETGCLDQGLVSACPLSMLHDFAGPTPESLRTVAPAWRSGFELILMQCEPGAPSRSNCPQRLGCRSCEVMEHSNAREVSGPDCIDYERGNRKCRACAVAVRQRRAEPATLPSRIHGGRRAGSTEEFP